MKTFDEIVEEVYNDTGLRGEFVACAKLMNVPSLNKKGPEGVEFPLYKGTERFVGYYEIREASILPWRQSGSPEVQKSRRGLDLLFSALCRCLGLKYKLSKPEEWTLVLNVIARYQSAENRTDFNALP